MLGPHTHRDNPLSRIMCAPIAPPVTVCHTMKMGLFIFSRLKKRRKPNNWTTFLFFSKEKNMPRTKMVKRNDKRVRTASDDAGGKSLSDTSTERLREKNGRIDETMGEGDKGKRVRTTSDDTGGKSVSEKSKSTGEKCE